MSRFKKHVEGKDGWTEWINPKPEGYLLKCCDCGLVHEMEFNVAKFEPLPSKEATFQDDPDLRVVFRARRKSAPRKKVLGEKS